MKNKTKGLKNILIIFVAYIVGEFCIALIAPFPFVFVLFTLLYVLVLILIFKRNTYSSKSISGVAMKSLQLADCHLRKDELYKLLLEKMPSKLTEDNIPFKMKETKFIIGLSVFNLQKTPMLLFKNTEFGYKFFHLGIAIDNNVIHFPLFGNSRENFRRNRNIQENIESTLTGEAKLFIPRPNQMILQKEELWRESIINCVVDVLGVEVL